MQSREGVGLELAAKLDIRSGWKRDDRFKRADSWGCRVGGLQTPPSPGDENWGPEPFFNFAAVSITAAVDSETAFGERNALKGTRDPLG